MNMYRTQRISHLSQFGILIGMLGVMMVVAGVIAGFIAAAVLHVPVLQVDAALKKVENADFARTLNTAAAFFIFFVPAIVWAKIMKPEPFGQLGFNNILSGKQVFLVIILSIVALMLSNVMGELNQHIPLPAKWLAKAKAFEKEYNESVSVMASMKNNRDYLVSLFVVAFCPAVFEEALFRGGFQQIFVGWTKRPWLGILITSILFSAIHLSFFGFLARAALGMVLGYVFYFSRNLWLNIALHFLNNAIIVSIFYSFSKSGKSIAEVEKITDKSSLSAVLLLAPISIMALISLFISFKKESVRIRPIEVAPPIDNENLLS